MVYSLPLPPLGPEFAEAGLDGWHLFGTGLLPHGNSRARWCLVVATAANRAEMLLLPFHGLLFQLAAREPESAPLFQLPPRMTALPSSPINFSTFQPLNPTTKHGTNFAYYRLGGF
jgi:hypothetical protein